MKNIMKICLLMAAFVCLAALTQGCKKPAAKATKVGAGLFVTNAYAETPAGTGVQAKNTSPGKKGEVILEKVKGVIASIDATKKTFVLKEEGKDVRMTFSGKPETVKKLALGEKVRVYYRKTAAGASEAVVVKKITEKG